MNLKRNKCLNYFLTLLFIGISIILCQQIISYAISNQQNKLDYAETNHIKYGLFSVDKWKEQLAIIVADEIDDLNLSAANERELKKQVESQLNALIDNVEKKIRESNKGTFKGSIKQSLINTFVSIPDIKLGIPEYADAIVKEMTKVKTEIKFKKVLKERIQQYFARTFVEQDLSHLNRVLERTQTTDIQSAREKLNQKIKAAEGAIYNRAITLIILSVFLFALTGFSKKPLPPLRYALLIMFLITLLVAGVTTPMIDMEAKISQMSFVLLGHTILFENQVLYFQSKSILDVFWIMFIHEDIKMNFVGLLMIAFSIFFPALKILSSAGYYFNIRGARTNWLIRFFVLKSGKWSMADVLVVSIFMAYIGFNGIISSQFGNLSSAGQDFVLLATNGTALQPGFYLFLTYTLLALFLSGFLTRKRGTEDTNVDAHLRPPS